MTATAGNLAARAALAFAAYRDGDRERMGELVDVLTPILWHTARSQRLDQQGAEDVIQIAWIRLSTLDQVCGAIRDMIGRGAPLPCADRTGFGAGAGAARGA